MIDFCENYYLLLFVKMAPTRKSFSTKFKAEVLKYITEKGCSNSAICGIFYEHFKKSVLLILLCVFKYIFRKHLENKLNQK